MQALVIMIIHFSILSMPCWSFSTKAMPVRGSCGPSWVNMAACHPPHVRTPPGHAVGEYKGVQNDA
jgi:hypothetical protein